jgi:hypothetical protein
MLKKHGRVQRKPPSLTKTRHALQERHVSPEKDRETKRQFTRDLHTCVRSPKFMFNKYLQPEVKKSKTFLPTESAWTHENGRSLMVDS